MRYRGKRILSILMIITIILISACNNVQEESQQIGSEDSQSKPSASIAAASAQTEEDVPLGRFVEEGLELPDGVSKYLAMQKLDDGVLQIVTIGEEEAIQSHISRDAGGTWEKQSYIPNDAIPAGYAVRAATINKQGTIFTSYGKIKQESVWGAQLEGKYSYNMITSEGEVKEILLPLTGDDTSGFGYGANIIGIAKNGDALYFTGEEFEPIIVYRIGADSLELMQTYEINAFHCDQTENAILYETPEGLMQLDLESGEEQGTLDLLEQFQGGSTRYAGSGETNTFYMANKSGIYRYVAGASIVEQLVDGSLVSLYSSDLWIVDMIYLNEQEFLIVLQDENYDQVLKRYRYDTEIPTIPNKELIVYSLRDNPDVRKMIVEYQNANPDTHVIYQMGMEDESMATTTDAIKSLNTEIMAGNGPDVLILNELPMESYIEKGILSELDSILEPRLENDELFENIIRAYEHDGVISAVPIGFKVPVVYGSTLARENIKDLEGVLAYLKSDEATSFSGDSVILGTLEYESILRPLLAVYGSSCIKENKIDKEQLRNFLSISKEIDDAIKGKLEYGVNSASVGDIPEEVLKKYDEYQGRNDGYYNENGIYGSVYSIMEGYGLMSLGSMTSMLDVVDLYNGTLQNEDFDYQLLNADTNYFMPSVMVGLNAKRNEQELGLSFIDFMVSQEGQTTQSMNMGYAFPINKSIFHQDMVKPSQTLFEKWMTNKNNFTWASEEAFERFEELVESLDTQGIMDYILFDTLSEQLRLYLRGEKSLEEAISEITQKMNLYLAE